MTGAPIILLNHVVIGDAPAWDVVIGDEAVHHLPVEASAEDAKALAAVWLGRSYGDGVVAWEPAGETAFLGRWSDA
jgi:hypothetical protein